MRDTILKEIRRLAEAQDGKAPGRLVFERETGIKSSAWRGVFWARWGDAIAEAGLPRNAKQGRLDGEDVFKKLAEAFRAFGRIPTSDELKIYARSSPGFPGHETIRQRFPSKADMLDRLADWAGGNGSFPEVVALLKDRPAVEQAEPRTAAAPEGLVYLIRSGAHYKIGRSDNLERRVKEIRIALPEAAELVHAIRTDDPPGIEAYWHRRFADRRANGEWFRLVAADVAAFRRRKYQ